MIKKYVFILATALLFVLPIASGATQLTYQRCPEASEIDKAGITCEIAGSDKADGSLAAGVVAEDPPTTNSATIPYSRGTTSQELAPKSASGASATVVSPPQIPEPASAILLGLGIIGYGAYRRLRK